MTYHSDLAVAGFQERGRVCVFRYEGVRDVLMDTGHMGSVPLHPCTVQSQTAAKDFPFP